MEKIGSICLGGVVAFLIKELLGMDFGDSDML